ncbi:MAG: hypothetical protein LBH46_03100 [Rickettsiales bacterium]|nr:hypothetical protein [Rickettsiales bacterium]
MIEKKIVEYVSMNRKFPCPASLSKKVSDDRYGLEERLSDSSCGVSDGIFSSKEELLYGFVPITTLGLPEEYGHDSYGRKIVYVIKKGTPKIGIDNFLRERNKYGFSVAGNNGNNNYLYVLFSFYKHQDGSYHFNSNTAVPFGNEITNMPVVDFELKKDDNYIFMEMLVDSFNLFELEEELKECEGENLPSELFLKLVIGSNSVGNVFNFKFTNGRFGEIIFSNELCPNDVKAQGYYYKSKPNYDNGILIDNRPAIKCGRDGKWEKEPAFICNELKSCAEPTAGWGSLLDGAISPTGINFPHTMEIDLENSAGEERSFVCIVTKDGAKWVKKN